MMKIPTARYRLDIASLRNDLRSDFVFRLAYLVYRPEGDKILCRARRPGHYLRARDINVSL